MNGVLSRVLGRSSLDSEIRVKINNVKTQATEANRRLDNLMAQLDGEDDWFLCVRKIADKNIEEVYVHNRRSCGDDD